MVAVNDFPKHVVWEQRQFGAALPSQDGHLVSFHGVRTCRLVCRVCVCVSCGEGVSNQGRGRGGNAAAGGKKRSQKGGQEAKPEEAKPAVLGAAAAAAGMAEGKKGGM